MVPIVLDGRLTEEPWLTAPAAGDFRQRDPDEGQPATERTEVRVLFDDAAVYIGARLFDRTPADIVRRLSRRDEGIDADYVEILIDPRHDHLTGAVFTVSAAASRRDGIVHNDSWVDHSWDAVWDSAVSVDDQGWVAEVRIPFSQLRFPAGTSQTWGLNLARFIRRKNELAVWELVPKNESGMASRMGHLAGLDGIAPRRHLELLPYGTARLGQDATVAAADPFHGGLQGLGGTGLDLKWGVTSDLTVDATVNPDFGQVEVDPAVVNLSAFETFFQEKRPFFIEGSQTFGNFARNGANNNWGFNRSTPDFTYFRRIGRAPQGPANGEFVDRPTETTILGAGKLTGKTKNGWIIGVLDAVTSRESATVEAGGRRQEVEVEPTSNYLIARARRDVGERGGYGGIVTSVTRRFETLSLVDRLASSAHVAGADGYIFLDRRKDWVITGGFAGSWINGSAAAIEQLQRASARYYQRPDARHVRVDSTAHSLSGWDGEINLNKNSGDKRVNASLWGVSPGFDSNDAGFSTMSDRAGGHAVFTWQKPTPDRVTRSRWLGVAKFWTWNFNRELQSNGYATFTNATLLNYWEVGGNFFYFHRTDDDRGTRGGPSMQDPGGWFANLFMGTDRRKLISVGVNGGRSSNPEGGWNADASLEVTIKPSPRLTVSTGPSLNRSFGLAQYVTTVTDPTSAVTFGGRYVFGEIEQTQVVMTTRVAAIFSPTLSLQVYAQPLLAVGAYRNFKQLAVPRSFSFTRYGADAGTIAYDAASSTYAVDPDGAGPAPRFTFGNPDFNFKSLRFNAILRWEWRLGSTFYAAFTQERVDFADAGTFRLGRDAGALFGAPSNNVFLVKVAYWLGR
jgi:hypothetical protein